MHAIEIREAGPTGPFLNFADAARRLRDGHGLVTVVAVYTETAEGHLAGQAVPGFDVRVSPPTARFTDPVSFKASGVSWPPLGSATAESARLFSELLRKAANLARTADELAGLAQVAEGETMSTVVVVMKDVVPPDHKDFIASGWPDVEVDDRLLTFPCALSAERDGCRLSLRGAERRSWVFNYDTVETWREI